MTTTAAPTPIPAAAPGDNDDDDDAAPLLLLEVALTAAVVEAVFAGDDDVVVVETELESTVDESVAVLVELVVGAVRAISTVGVKTHELADGLAELSDE